MEQEPLVLSIIILFHKWTPLTFGKHKVYFLLSRSTEPASTLVLHNSLYPISHHSVFSEETQTKVPFESKSTFD